MATETKTRKPGELFDMEDTINTITENNKRTLTATIEFSRNSLNSGYQMAKDIQEEQVRFADAMVDQMAKFQKSYLKSVQAYSQEFFRFTEKAMKDNQDMMVDAMDKTMEMVGPNARRRNG